jgi:hypothetical protein
MGAGVRQNLRTLHKHIGAIKMKIYIAKRDYAKGLIPWCPYIGGFWYNLFKRRMSTLFWLGYKINVWR